MSPLTLEPTFWRDMAAMHMVSDMMRCGIKVDVPYFQSLSDYLLTRRNDIGVELDVAIILAGVELPPDTSINPNSPLQVERLMYEPPPVGLGLRALFPRMSGTGDESVKMALADPRVHDNVKDVLRLIQDWRGYAKLKGTYSDPIPGLVDDNSRVHSTFRFTRTTTGRLSSSEPNLMAQPVRSSEGKKIRDGFVAENGCMLTSSDYSQIEMRVAAHTFQDPRLIDIFTRGLDIHSQTASNMFGIPIDQLDEMKHRYPAKRVGFGVLYGLSAEGLQATMVEGGAALSDWSVDSCQSLIDGWFDVYKGVRDGMEAVRDQARRYGFVTDMHGRRRYIPHARSKNRHLREEALRQACNAPIQMGAQGVIKEAMGQLVNVYRRWRRDGYVWNPLIQIHDDLVDEMDESLMPVMMLEKNSIMESAVKLCVPVKVDSKVGKHWGSLEKYKVE